MSSLYKVEMLTYTLSIINSSRFPIYTSLLINQIFIINKYKHLIVMMTRVSSLYHSCMVRGLEQLK